MGLAKAEGGWILPTHQKSLDDEMVTVDNVHILNKRCSELEDILLTIANAQHTFLLFPQA